MKNRYILRTAIEERADHIRPNSVGCGSGRGHRAFKPHYYQQPAGLNGEQLRLASTVCSHRNKQSRPSVFDMERGFRVST
jgi:hypothetical protein